MKDIYKCSECEAKLEIEKKGSQYKVKMQNNGEPHNWCDEKHVEVFNQPVDPKSANLASSRPTTDKVHTSVECFVKLQLRNGVSISPDHILENLRKERS